MFFDVNTRRNLTHLHKQCNSQREKYKHTVNWIRSQSVHADNKILCRRLDEEALRVVLTNI